MDRNVGRLLDWLESQDLRSNTLVVFMGDNGMNMGHHGIYGKGNGLGQGVGSAMCGLTCRVWA